MENTPSKVFWSTTRKLCTSTSAPCSAVVEPCFIAGNEELELVLIAIVEADGLTGTVVPVLVAVSVLIVATPNVYINTFKNMFSLLFTTCKMLLLHIFQLS